MPSLSHESFTSKPDKNGFSQRISIDAMRRLNKTTHSDIYEGLAFISDNSSNKIQKKVLAKFLKDSEDNLESRQFASHTVNLNKNLNDSAREFNNSMKCMLAVKKDLPGTETSNRVHFQVLQMNLLDSVSFCDKKRRKGEYFVFGEKLADCKVFIDTQREVLETKAESEKRKRAKSVNYGDETPKRKNRSRTISLRDDNGDVNESACTDDFEYVCLHAFVHFFFCQKNGQMAADCLRGNYSHENGYTLITPTVHSLSGGFGPNDCREDGIRRVIRFHECNALCKHLPNMRDILNNALRDEKTRQEAASASGNTSLLEDGQEFQERAVYSNFGQSHDFRSSRESSLYQTLHRYDQIWQSNDLRSSRESSLYPTLPRYDQIWQEGTTVYMPQCHHAPSIGQLWQERTMYEKREKDLQEIHRYCS